MPPPYAPLPEILSETLLFTPRRGRVNALGRDQLMWCARRTATGAAPVAADRAEVPCRCVLHHPIVPCTRIVMEQRHGLGRTGFVGGVESLAGGGVNALENGFSRTGRGSCRPLSSRLPSESAVAKHRRTAFDLSQGDGATD